MLSKAQRIESLIKLSAKTSQSNNSEIFELARQRNGFFIPIFCEKAVQSILSWLTAESLKEWTKDVDDTKSNQAYKIGVILAGNIPLVGWHDLMTIFISGNIACYKPSSNDEVLIDWFLNALFEVEPEAKFHFRKTEKMNAIDAIIATGSTNTATHFNYYFKQSPRLIRGSKTSL